MNGEDICLVDSANTHIILRNKIYFTCLILEEDNVNTISGTANLIEGFGRANIMLSVGTELYISNALYSANSEKICLVLKKSATTDITLKPKMNLLLNIFALP